MSMKSGQTTAPTSIRAGWYGVLHIARVSGPRKIQLGLRRREFVVHAGSLEVNWRPPYASQRERIIRAELSGNA